jgi:PEP-CTERM motif
MSKLRRLALLGTLLSLALGFGAPAQAGPISLYVSDYNGNSVEQFDGLTGAHVRTLVSSPGPNPPLGPVGLIVAPAGNLVVVWQNPNLPISSDVYHYDVATGASRGALIPNSNPNAPFQGRGVILGPNNTLFVGDAGGWNGANPHDPILGQVRLFDATTGAFKGNLPTPTGLAAFAWNPRGVVIGPDGLLYVSSPAENALGGGVFRFNPVTGAYLGQFVASNPTNDLNRPEGIVFGPDGKLYVASFRTDASDNDKVLEFDGKTGAYLGNIPLDQPGQPRAFAQDILFGPGGFLYVPITGGDAADAGGVRRYNVATGTFDDFIPGGTMQGPSYLFFINTDPGTLAFVSVPEPTSALLLGLGVCAVIGGRLWRRRTRPGAT